MTKEETLIIKRKLRQMINELDSIKNKYPKNLNDDWHGYVGEACCALRIAIDSPIPQPEPSIWCNGTGWRICISNKCEYCKSSGLACFR